VKLLALAAVCSLAIPAAPGSRFVDARVAYTLWIPPGWHAVVDHGATRITSRDGGYVWVFDYGRIPGDFPERPDRLELGRKEVHGCGFGEGYMLHFRDQGRLLQAFVRLGPSTEEHDALTLLNSLRVTK
jgi:hypothetical protein